MRPSMPHRSISLLTSWAWSRRPSRRRLRGRPASCASPQRPRPAKSVPGAGYALAPADTRAHHAPTDTLAAGVAADPVSLSGRPGQSSKGPGRERKVGLSRQRLTGSRRDHADAQRQRQRHRRRRRWRGLALRAGSSITRACWTSPPPGCFSPMPTRFCTRWSRPASAPGTWSWFGCDTRGGLPGLLTNRPSRQAPASDRHPNQDFQRARSA